jgi:hypothetical protein
MMDDHILARTQQRLPGERTPSRGTPANHEQRLIHPNDFPTKRTKHATRHSPDYPDRRRDAVSIPPTPPCTSPQTPPA